MMKKILSLIFVDLLLVLMWSESMMDAPADLKMADTVDLPVAIPPVSPATIKPYLLSTYPGMKSL